MKIFTAAFAAILLGMPMLGACQAESRDPDRQAVPPTPMSVKRVLVARPFTLRTPYAFTWSSDKPQVSSGTLVVLDVDGAYVVPRNATVGPTLYAGDTPVQRLNHGHLSGKVIGIVPGAVDLTIVPIWFGAPDPQEGLPATAPTERRRSERAALAPLPAAQIRAARRAPVTATDLAALLRTVGADLVLEFSPQEKSLAEIWRLPTAKPPPAKRDY